MQIGGNDLELRNGIYHIGINVPALHTFDLYAQNISCNAYVVKGEKTALIDTAPQCCQDEFLKKVEEITDVSKIDYIICNHTEQNHSGIVEKLLEINPKAKVTATIAGLRNLKEITNIQFNELVAKDGMKIDLGGKTLEFIITPNLPWPDTMVTYCIEEKTLFSCDIFSSYGSEKEYYDIKMSNFSDFAQTAAKRISKLDIDIICTGMGEAVKNTDIIAKYIQWSEKTEKDKVTAAVIYASAYGTTEQMAQIVSDVLKQNNIEVRLIDADNVSAEINSADVLIFGTPTINRNAPKKIWNAIAQLDAISAKGKPCFVFGSYGWGGEALMLVHNHLRQLKLDMFEKPFSAVFALSEQKARELKEYTSRFVENGIYKKK